MKWSRDLAELRGGSGTLKASIATHSLVNTFWVRQRATRINDGARLAYLDSQGQGRAWHLD